MKIKLICFDFDGVLCELKEVHYKSLNNAIIEVAGLEYIISEEEHISTFDGLSTKTKLNKLVDLKNLDKNLITDIFNLKQKYTIEAIKELIQPNLQLRKDLFDLKSERL